MPLEYLLVLGLVLLNLFISWWNCKAVGSIWYESKQVGGFRRFIVWMGALMAGAGFTWCYFIIIGVGLAAGDVLDEEQLQLLFNIGYLMVIPVVLFAGYAITFNSWRKLYHQRTVGNFGEAAWNTFATGYNTYNAVSGIPSAIGSVMSSLKPRNSEDAKGIAVLFVFLIAIAAALLGVITTVLLIKHYAARESLETKHPERFALDQA